jgi:UPF0271 protein
MLIDLNCDLGEGAANDAELLSLITTANVACGFHAGDAETAHLTIAAAAASGVRVGAHPSFPDRENLGRQEMTRSDRRVYEDCVYQVGALAALAASCDAKLTHIKPHGALYNQACRDSYYAEPLVAAAALFDLPIMGLPDSQLQRLAGKRFIAEGFADRRYRDDGSLVPRTEPNAFLHEPAEAARQALDLVRNHGVRTLCVHGDNPQAVDFVRALRQALTANGFTIQAFA